MGSPLVLLLSSTETFLLSDSVRLSMTASAPTRSAKAKTDHCSGLTRKSPIPSPSSSVVAASYSLTHSLTLPTHSVHRRATHGPLLDRGHSCVSFLSILSFSFSVADTGALAQNRHGHCPRYPEGFRAPLQHYILVCSHVDFLLLGLHGH